MMGNVMSILSAWYFIKYIIKHEKAAIEIILMQLLCRLKALNKSA
jgi:hypothetical protein